MSNPGMRIIKSFKHPSNSVIERLKGVASANLSDCMARLFAMDARISPIGKTKYLVGPALTVKSALADNFVFHKAISLAQPGDIIVVNAGGDLNHSVCGDIMYQYARSKGVAGFIIDGSVRDINYLMNNDFPVFAAGVTPRGPYKNGPGEINTDIVCGGQVVHPGDILVGDEDGVVVIRPEDLDTVFERLEALQNNEMLLSNIIQQGKWEEESPILKAVNAAIEKNGFEIIE